MAIMEVAPVRECETDLRLHPPDLALPGGVEGTTGPMAGVLILRSSSLSHSTVRRAALRAGLPIALTPALHRSDVLEVLNRGSIDVILAGVGGLPDLSFQELIEKAGAARPPVPVILVGRQIEESSVLELLRAGAADYVEFSMLDRLPSAIERALLAREQREAQARTQRELDVAAGTLRDTQRLITVGRLAASIVHEINNPLESVTNLLYLLGEETSLSDSARGYLDMARRELDRVSKISHQTLNFVREAPSPQRTRIDELLDEVLSLYGRRIAEKNITVRRQYDYSEETTVYPGEMRQVLSNLLTNAIEASAENGSLCLRIRGSRSWSDPGVRGIRISVGDNGSGMEPAVQRRLGEPFFTTRGQKGTGLGLWVTRSIVQRHGGEIQLRSSTAPGRHGTVFSIFLPTNLGPRAVQNPPEIDDENGGSGAKVLRLAGGVSRRAGNQATGRRRVSGE